jgi:hypothetical protein
MTDWADYALEKLNKQEHDKHRNDEKFLEVQRLKRVHGTPLWQEVKRIVEENIKQLNIKAGKSVITLRVTNILTIEAYLTTGTHRTLRAEFKQDTGSLEWECEDKSGSWDVGVGEDGKPSFYWGMIPSKSESVAKQMLDPLLFG